MGVFVILLYSEVHIIKKTGKPPNLLATANSDLIILSLCVCVSAAAAAVCALDCESPDIFPGDSSYRPP